MPLAVYSPVPNASPIPRRELENKASTVDATLLRCTALEARVAELDATVTALRVERQSAGWDPAVRAAWDIERAQWAVERDAGRAREGEWQRECEGLKGMLEESRRHAMELRTGGEKRGGEDEGASEPGPAKRARP